jgi:hypothetical protein
MTISDQYTSNLYTFVSGTTTTAQTDQYNAQQPNQSSNSAPTSFTAGSPTLPQTTLTSYQLALANELMIGTTPPFGVNPDFIRAMNTFTSSKLLTPATKNSEGGIIQPPFAPGMTGNAYIVLGSTIYLVRQALDCGPGETDRYETVAIENLANTTIRTWQYYGDPQPSGSASTGTGTDGTVGDL